jgi:uncharacterized phage protein gp47/JayE
MSKNYDAILSEILCDMSNIAIERPDGTYTMPSTVKGSVFYVLAAALAGCVWGIQQDREWLLRQIFASTATDENLERHAVNVGLTRLPNETRQQLLERYLVKRRGMIVMDSPEQYRAWALSVEGVKNVWVWTGDYGAGTLSIDVTAYTDDEMPPAELLNAVYAAVTDPAKASAWRGRVFVRAPEFIKPDVSITTSQGTPAVIAATVRGYLDGLDCGVSLTKEAIAVILYNMEITAYTTVFMVGDEFVNEVTASKHNLIRPGVIKINNVIYE